MHHAWDLTHVFFPIRLFSYNLNWSINTVIGNLPFKPYGSFWMNNCSFFNNIGVLTKNKDTNVCTKLSSFYYLRILKSNFFHNGSQYTFAEKKVAKPHKLLWQQWDLKNTFDEYSLKLKHFGYLVLFPLFITTCSFYIEPIYILLYS